MSDLIIPLFPLEVVLFPGSALPLHIFEERYKVLIQECLDEKREFGINLLLDGKVAPVGCSASVVSVLRTYSDGRFDVVVEGERRYALNRYDSGSALYLVGEVEYFEPADQPAEEMLGKETVRLYNQLIATVYGDTLPRVEHTLDDRHLSFKLAQKAGMDLQHRQRLLELPTEQERIEMLHTYLTEVIPKLERLSEVERVIRSDGYL
ncbi:MAG: LON peptidase substrate-binding domain-containing protein [Ignavibacteria bacterium]|nr:LON peptidase substrate-binding domain-containing protein [Ignavibacteria bacterium]